MGFFKILSCALMVALLAGFPKVDPEKSLASLKVVKDGSPLRQPREDWREARRRVNENPRWKNWLRETREETDEWIAKRRDRVEWVAGWWHDFVDPIDGSFLLWTPDEPGERTLKSRSGREVQLTEKLHRAWVYTFRTRHIGHMEESALLYQLTAEEKYARWAADQLEFYSINYRQWPLQTERGRARIMHQSLDEAVNLVRLVNTARFLGDYVGKEQRDRWFKDLFKPEADLLDETFQRIHNIACWQRSAMAHVALFGKDERLWERAVHGPFGIRKQLEEGVTSDYLWFEQSLGYNSYVVRALYPIFLYASLEGRGAQLKWEMAVVENLMLSPIALRFPTGQLPNPADSTGGPGRAPNLDLLASCYRLFPTPGGLKQASGKTNWDTLLDPPESGGAVDLPPLSSQNLESSRMAVLRHGSWQVYFHYGQLDRSHAQQEALNFEAFFGDLDVTHDPGTVGYGSPLHGGYFTRGAAHNVPLIAGKGQNGWDPGKLDLFDARKARVAASQPKYRPDTEARRELNIEGISLIDRVTVKTKENGPVGLVLHLQGEVQLPESFRPDEQFASTRDPALKHWTGVKTASFNEHASFLVRYPGQTMRVSFNLPGHFTVSHGRSPDVPPRERDSLYIETGGGQATFETIIEPEETAKSASLVHE